MTRAFFAHLWRLMLGAHSLRGLPRKSFSLWLLLVIASVAVAFIRHGSPVAALFWCAFLFALTYVNNRLSSAIAMLSIGIDALAVAFRDVHSHVWLVWETATQVVIFYRAFKGKIND